MLSRNNWPLLQCKLSDILLPYGASLAEMYIQAALRVFKLARITFLQ